MLHIASAAAVAAIHWWWKGTGKYWILFLYIHVMWELQYPATQMKVERYSSGSQANVNKDQIWTDNSWPNPLEYNVIIL